MVPESKARVPAPAGGELTFDDHVLVVSENEGTTWLWAYPELLCWPSPITWLFSPVNSRQRWPGDLWGVDNDGNLLVVEAKRASRARRRCDPMEDLVAVEAKELTSGEIKQRWEHLWELERRRLAQEKPCQIDEQRACPGVLPYSSRRRAWARWPALYGQVTDQLQRDEYVTVALRGMAKLRRMPKPHYVGLMVVAAHVDPGLSARGKEHFLNLPRGRRHLRAVWAERSPQRNHIHLEGWVLEP